MVLGLLCGLLACALWGVTYSLTGLLPEYTPMQIGLIRCCITGLLALALLYPARKEVLQLSRSDWIVLLKLSLLGTLLNFLAQLYCCDLAGPSVGGMTTGAIPVLVAVIANEQERRNGNHYLPFKKIAIPCTMIIVGFVLCNAAEWHTGSGNALEFAVGLAFGLLHTALWTWFPLANAKWLKGNTSVGSGTWAMLQFAVLGPVAAVGYIIYWLFFLPNTPFIGTAPVKMATILSLNGVFCCLLAMTFWNVLCRRVPTTITGPMIVFETIFAVIIAHALQGRMPEVSMLIGVILLVIGVVVALISFAKVAEKSSRANGEKHDQRENQS